MASLLIGNVYYNKTFVGYLREEPGNRSSFAYDESYLTAGLPSVSHTLPLRVEPYVTEAGLLPFFDNLVSEGWLEDAQTRLLGKRHASRFELLLVFGQDCAGAVSVVDAEPRKLTQALLHEGDPIEMAVMTSRASLSGVQPKLTLIERNGKLYPARVGELSTYIAKFPSQSHNDLVTNEFLTTLAFKALLPTDDVVDMRIGNLEGFADPALIIKRFDRDNTGGRIHFEEFNQLLDHRSSEKYDGAYHDMTDFIWDTKGCMPAEVLRLFLRILAGILLGNTDAHLKNFAMFHTKDGLRLTPVYDQVAASLYQYQTLALAVGGTANLKIGDLKSKHIALLGKECRLSTDTINMACEQLKRRREAAKEAIFGAQIGTTTLKDQLIEMMEKRWNGTFASIGKVLSTKR